MSNLTVRDIITLKKREVRFMAWEIVLAIVLLVGTYITIREAREKRSARKKKTGEIASEKHSGEGSSRQNSG